VDYEGIMGSLVAWAIALPISAFSQDQHRNNALTYRGSRKVVAAIAVEIEIGRLGKSIQ